MTLRAKISALQAKAAGFQQQLMHETALAGQEALSLLQSKAAAADELALARAADLEALHDVQREAEAARAALLAQLAAAEMTISGFAGRLQALQEKEAAEAEQLHSARARQAEQDQLLAALHEQERAQNARLAVVQADAASNLSSALAELSFSDGEQAQKAQEQAQAEFRRKLHESQEQELAEAQEIKKLRRELRKKSKQVRIRIPAVDSLSSPCS